MSYIKRLNFNGPYSTMKDSTADLVLKRWSSWWNKKDNVVLHFFQLLRNGVLANFIPIDAYNAAPVLVLCKNGGGRGRNLQYWLSRVSVLNLYNALNVMANVPIQEFEEERRHDKPFQMNKNLQTWFWGSLIAVYLPNYTCSVNCL